MFKLSRKRGYIILLLTSSVLVLSFSAAQVFFNAAFTEYQTASHQANYTRAKYLSQSGIEAALFFINELEQYGFFEDNFLPPIPLGEHVISLEAEDLNSKFRVNQLVNFFDDSPNGKLRSQLSRLSQNLKISPDLWDAVIDWIDTNNTPETYGYERSDYESLDPPRKIKNSAISSLEELLLIPGFTRNLLFSDLRTEDEKEDIQELFSTHEEKELVKDEDFILANNITYELPLNPRSDDSINLNTAPYLVILSLHDGMTPEIVKDILVKRDELDNKLDNKALRTIPGIPEDFIPDTQSGFNAFSVAYKSQLYKIRATTTVQSQTAQISITYDKRSNKVIDYAE